MDCFSSLFHSRIQSNLRRTGRIQYFSCTSSREQKGNKTRTFPPHTERTNDDHTITTVRSRKIRAKQRGKRRKTGTKEPKKKEDGHRPRKKKTSGTRTGNRVTFRLHNPSTVHGHGNRPGYRWALSPSGRDRKSAKNQRFPKHTRVFATLLSNHIRQRWPHRLIFCALSLSRGCNTLPKAVKRRLSPAVKLTAVQAKIRPVLTVRTFLKGD